MFVVLHLLPLLLQAARAEIKAEVERDLKRKYAQLALPPGVVAPPQGGLDHLSARAKKRAKAKANRALALTNGGVGDGTGGGGSSASGGPGGDKGKGKGKGKGNRTDDGKPICFNWNKGLPCKSSKCSTAE